ncbi:MAG: hypothetical protein K6F51_08375 [Acetatifactor sp.]|nr:hypothetical protein [Acetatifactor sp.]
MADGENGFVENGEGGDARQKAELVVRDLCVKWKSQFAAKKKEWDQDPRWPAKCVETTFKLYGQEFSLGPADIGLSSDPWDQGFMESVKGIMRDDLEKEGATNVRRYGFLD